MTELLAMILLGIVCWVFRVTFVLLVPADRLPALVLRGLEYLAPAVLAGIAAVELTAVITGGDGGGEVGGTLASLAAMALVAVVAYLTRNLAAVVGVGLAAILLIDLVIL